MNKVVIVGGAGFIGRQSIEHLVRSGFEVHVVDLVSLPDFAADVTWHAVNLVYEHQIQKLFHEIRPSHLLSFAWFTRHGEYWNSAENFASLTSNFKLLELFAESGGKRVVMAGSCAEYDWSHGVCIENHTPRLPATVYGSCKLAMYELLRSFAIVKGLSWCWGRIFFAFGPFENPNRFVPAITLPLLRQEHAPCSHGNQIRDFLSTSDIGSAFAELVKSDLQGAVNVASGLPISLKQIARMIESIVNMSGAVKFGEIISPLDEPPIIIASVKRLRDELGWSPEKSIEQRFEEVIAWWKNNER